jgi:hypothetical protein
MNIFSEAEAARRTQSADFVAELVVDLSALLFADESEALLLAEDSFVDESFLDESFVSELVFVSVVPFVAPESAGLRA